MRVALFAAGVALAVVILIILVKKDDSKPTKSVATSSEGSAGESLPPPSTPERSPTPEHAPTPAGSATESVEATIARPETAVADAFAALTSGDAANALAIAEQVLAREPDHKGMKKVAAMAACALGKADVAQKYYEAAERSARANISSICQQHGIRLHAVAKRPESAPDHTRAGSAR
jgi:cytoskeletal protein RodZ